MKKIIIQVILALVAIFLAYKCYESVNNPLEFQKAAAPHTVLTLPAHKWEQS